MSMQSPVTESTQATPASAHTDAIGNISPVAEPVDVRRPRSSAAQLLLSTLALLFTLWATRELLIPLLLAMFFALIGNPIIRFLKRMYLPRFLGALLVLAGGLTAAGLLVNQLIDPATTWVHQAPTQLHELAPKLRALMKPMQEANTAAQSIAQAASTGASKPTQVIKTEVNDPWSDFTNTPKRIAAVLAVILLTFFFMVFGENLQRKAIGMLPSYAQKRITVEILTAVEAEVSRYVLTITVINCVVGALLAGILFWIGLPLQQALLWGTLMALLNFAPYVGPMIGVGVMLLMGFVTFHGVFASLLPAMVYLGLHVMEGEIVTPIILGKRMAISPLMLILALMVCGWMWGIAGLLLAVPMMVCVKIVLSKIDGLSNWAILLE